MSYLPLVVSAALTAVLTFAAIRYFPRLGLLDNPKKYGLKRAPIPYFGGIVIFCAIVACTLVFVPLSKEVLGLLAGATLLALTAFLDDSRGLPPLARLAIQIAAAGLLVVSGVGVTSIGGTIDLTIFDIPIFFGANEFHIFLLADLFTIFWVVLLTNSMNWFDGVPGLSSGIGGLVALVIFFLAARPDFHFFDQSTTIALAAIVAGSALAFTLFNFPPPKILLGDTGSMLLGFLIAALAIFSGGKVATAALALGVPILDAAWVILRRIFVDHKSPFRGDLGHFHHRLLAAGFSPRQVVLILYAATVAFGAAALFVPTTLGKLAVGGVLLVGMLTAGWLLRGKILKKES